MAWRDLREFLDALSTEGELRKIGVEMDPHLEITEVTDRVSKKNGPALLFENPTGSNIPLAINVLGSQKRMLMALGVTDYGEIDKRIAAFFDHSAPEGLLDKLKALPQMAELAGAFPKIVRKALCQEMVYGPGEFPLSKLPVLKCWPDDGGPFITLPLVFTKDPESGKRNCGIYRMQVYDDTTTGMHWHLHKHGAEHARRWAERGEKIEVAAAIGGDPVTVWSGSAPLPDDVDEMILAGFLRKKAVEMVRCKTVDLEVPANSEIVLEGWVDPNELRREGPFGDHTGFYSLADDYPVFHVECVTTRKNPIYQTTIVGRPPMEDGHMGYAIERVTLPILKKQIPEVVDVHMPLEGVFHNLFLVSIKKRYPGQARKVMHAIWGLGQAMFTKVIVVVDEDCNLHDPSEVAWRALNHIDPLRDFELTQGPADILDHAAPHLGYGSKVGIDATKKWPSEGFEREWPDEILMDESVKERVDKLWSQLGLD